MDGVADAILNARTVQSASIEVGGKSEKVFDRKYLARGGGMFGFIVATAHPFPSKYSGIIRRFTKSRVHESGLCNKG